MLQPEQKKRLNLMDDIPCRRFFRQPDQPVLRR
jgi:hypothetical protein